MGVYLYTNERLPGENTVAYYPLNSTTTVNDKSGNSKNLTNNGGVTFGTYGGVDCVSFDNTQTKGLTSSLGMTGNPIFTFNVRVYRLGYSIGVGKSQIFMVGPIQANTSQIGVAINGANGGNNDYQYWTWGTADVNTGAISSINVWEFVTFTNDGTTKKFYRNGTLIKQGSLSYSITGGNLTIGSFPNYIESGNYQSFYGYMSEFIVENKERTATEISNYFNVYKGNYGIS